MHQRHWLSTAANHVRMGSHRLATASPAGIVLRPDQSGTADVGSATGGTAALGVGTAELTMVAPTAGARC
eukprot:3658679-Alexandrium_andersonii.AAC.1